MKVIHINGNIINCEEIRNVTKINDVIRVYFKNNFGHKEYVSILCESEDDADDVMSFIFKQMTTK